MKLKIRYILAILTAILFTVNVQANNLNYKFIDSSKKLNIKYAPHQLIVRFKKNKSINTLFNQTQSMSINSTSLGKLKNNEEISIVKIKKDIDLKSALATYKADPNVLAVSYDYYLELYFAPNDTEYVKNPNPMWGLHDTAPDLSPFVGNDPISNPNSNDKTIGNDIDAERAWDIWNKVSNINKSNVVVAVIDSGVDYTHPDLVNAMWDGSNATVAGQPSPTPNHGRNVADNTNDPYPATSIHGTHVSGTIAATANNAIGIPGVASGVKIMAIKVSSEMDDFILNSSVISGINYAIENGADIINMSLGGEGAENPVMTSVIKDAVDAGILIVVAAGNSGKNNDFVDAWPTNYANHALTKSSVISVAATDQADLIAGFSNTGAKSVSIGAPGVNIRSTITGIESLPENRELGQSVVANSGTGFGNIALCSNNPNTCFSNTIFANPNGVDCSGSACRWGWKQEPGVLRDRQGFLIETLVIYADNNATGTRNYGNSINGTITSKIINTLNKKAVLKYEAQWDLECGNGNRDYVDVEVYDGNKWVLLNKSTAFNLNSPVISGRNLNPCQSSHTIIGHMAQYPVQPPIGFTTIYHDLSQYNNANMRVRFTFVTNASVNSTIVKSGFQMQNVRVSTQVSDYSKSYLFLDGTSMSSPHVAGIAALVKGTFPSYNGAQIKAAIISAGDANSSLAGKTTSGKRANAYNAIRAPLVEQPPVLSTLTNKNVNAGNTLNFVVSANDVNGITPVLSISGAPVNAVFTDKQNGTATFSWATTVNDINTYNVSFTATDGNRTTPGSDINAIKITVSAKSGSSTGNSNSLDSGGCIINNRAKFDPILLVLLLLSFLYFTRKQKLKF